MRKAQCFILWEAGSKEIVEEEIREFDSLWQNTNEFVEVYEYQKTAEKKLLDIIDKRTNKNKQKRECSSWRQDTKHKVFTSVDWQRKNFAFTLKHRG